VPSAVLTNLLPEESEKLSEQHGVNAVGRQAWSIRTLHILNPATDRVFAVRRRNVPNQARGRKIMPNTSTKSSLQLH
jgi:hypothetical protein